MSTTTAFWTMVTDTTKVAGQTLVYPVTITAIDDKPVATVPILGATTSTILPGTSSTSSTSSVNSALVTPPYPSQNSSSTSTSLTDSTPPQTSITASIAISSGTTSWTLIPYSTTLTAPWQSGQVLSGEVNATVPITKKVSGGISTGATAGIAIATALAGALIAAAVFFMVSKRHKSHRPRQQHEPATLIADRPRNEKSVVQAYTASNQDDDFDLDRLLPQPLDDSGVKREAEKLFSQIDAHVDSFYTDSSTSLSPHLNRNTAQALEHPASRFFMAKRLICSDVLESISPKCTSDRSLLPRGYTSMARMMREPDVDDRATILSWSRFRTSLLFLLRQDSSSDQDRQAVAVSILIKKLDNDLGSLSDPNSNESRIKDLEAILREGAALGRTLLAQPAEWRFEWTPLAKRNDGSLVAESKAGLVYFPALVRLTDNKAKKLQTPRLALQARYMQ